MINTKRPAVSKEKTSKHEERAKKLKVAQDKFKKVQQDDLNNVEEPTQVVNEMHIRKNKKEKKVVEPVEEVEEAEGEQNEEEQEENQKGTSIPPILFLITNSPSRCSI